jgi:hypothetical protein
MVGLQYQKFFPFVYLTFPALGYKLVRLCLSASQKDFITYCYGVKLARYVYNKVIYVLNTAMKGSPELIKGAADSTTVDWKINVL